MKSSASDHTARCGLFRCQHRDFRPAVPVAHTAAAAPDGNPAAADTAPVVDTAAFEAADTAVAGSDTCCFPFCFILREGHFDFPASHVIFYLSALIVRCGLKRLKFSRRLNGDSQFRSYERDDFVDVMNELADIQFRCAHDPCRSP